MLWRNRRESVNVQDLRGRGGKVLIGGGLGLGGLIIYLIANFMGVDPGLLTQVNTDNPTAQTTRGPRPDDEAASFTKVVFNDTETVWRELFSQMGRTYRPPTLVLFDGAVSSACGSASSAVGPFYCPRDSKIYIDLSFYRAMDQKLQAEGDFAKAYVIAHEVGHHVQRLLGFSRRDESNTESVRLELQADYLAGVWARHAEEKYKFLEEGDLEEAMNAASAVGDDKLQSRARGYAVPDSFTHGTSAQRMAWFKRGFETGDIKGAAELFDSPAQGE
jgi:uncharacterized protein